MKVIIPVAGIGSRLAPHTFTVPKALVHVAGKELLAHILDKVADIKEVTEVVFVVGYLGEQIVDFVNENYKFKSKFIFQKERKGLGHAIYMAINEFDNKENEPVTIILGDTLFDMDLNKIFEEKGDGVIVTSIVENPERFGVVVKKNNFITDFIEKPETPVSNRAIVGIYFIKNLTMLVESLKFIIDNNIKTRGEYQLTDALQRMLKKGANFTDVLSNKWFDCGKPETLLETNREFLKLAKNENEKKYRNTVLIEPVYISPNAVVENSIIGPYVSIAPDTKIRSSIIRDSIINRGAKIKSCIMADSLIGHNAVVSSRYSKFNISDSSEFEA